MATSHIPTAIHSQQTLQHRGNRQSMLSIHPIWLFAQTNCSNLLPFKQQLK